MKQKRLVADTAAGIIILIGIKIPSFLLHTPYFSFIQNQNDLYAIEYLLTSLFAFVFILYLAYFIRKLIKDKESGNT